ncbi:MAG: peptidoglycan-binding protein [Candidatus Omnitrophica bacterium]|nr:peptidoglycan-binding protein [Candidatus Omnitrophota bacterium]MBU1997507.1 peptidoglycan-binding protein [Candidatus Omnitrophota bacterium]MBU4333532.1 peptidoglycan-binding protein [Candidatus Omnitrophota bacterium]
MHKKVNFVLFAGLLFSFVNICGCDALYRTLDKEGADEKELVGDIELHEANPAIEEIQTLLKIYGYDPGIIDGKWGLKTRNAVERFQKDVGLKETRKVDNETWLKLIEFKEKRLIKDGKLNMHLIQEILSVAEVYDGKIDGKVGRKTKQAVIDFQKKHGLKQDGKIGYKTISKMAEYIEIEN